MQWNFEAIDLPHAWEINPGATSDVTVAVVDTGLNVVSDSVVFDSPFAAPVALRFAAVPDLVTDSRIVKPFDFVWRDEFPFDFQGHGTHVAGTIGQETNNSTGLAGVAFHLRLMPLKVLADSYWDLIFNPFNNGNTDEIVAEAVRYAADNGAHVINLGLMTYRLPSDVLLAPRCSFRCVEAICW